MGAEESYPSPRVSPSIPRVPTPTHEMLIVVRGQRGVGKTTLVRMMSGNAFNKEYTVTPSLEASEIEWKSPGADGELIKVKVWDVPEKALLPANSIENKELPDASTVDTLEKADGLIVIIDKRHADTIDLAMSIVQEAPYDLPICIFWNFGDEIDEIPSIPEKLLPLLNRFLFIPGSLYSGAGLATLAKWLSLPLKASKKRQFYHLLKNAEEDLNLLLADSAEATAQFVTPHGPSLFIDKAALPPPSLPQSLPVVDKLPVSPPKTPESVQTQKPKLKPKSIQPQPVGDEIGDDFWGSDEGNDEDEMDLGENEEEEELRPNPKVIQPVKGKPKEQKKSAILNPPPMPPADQEPEIAGSFWSDSEDEPVIEQLNLRPIELKVPGQDDPIIQTEPKLEQKIEVEDNEQEQEHSEEEEVVHKQHRRRHSSRKPRNTSTEQMQGGYEDI